jgi:2-polyprenyl-3-methyl-5-hydroxy-6-metoxy-1,4-benzoquinol methylase
MEIIERIMPGLADVEASRREHPADWARYEHGAKLVPGKRVMDCACGAGYGSWTLGRAGAKSVVGVDLSSKAVAWASANFALPNVQFRQATPDRFPLDDGEVELAISFETIEHVPEQAAPNFVRELARVLEPGGTLLLSTPLTRGAARLKPDNEFHLREYDEDELAALLAPCFVIEKRFGQHSREAAQFARAKKAPGLRALIGSGAHRLVPPRVRAAIRTRLFASAADTSDAWITETDWRDAPVKMVLARKR